MVNVLDTRGKPRPRHPEKMHRPQTDPIEKPEWVRVRLTQSPAIASTRSELESRGLSTVCEEAGCPNLATCWEHGHATFMIMGEICTRACAFCNVTTGLPLPLDPDEPRRVADAAAALGLGHVVVTSVDRDDLGDGGAVHFAAVVRALRGACPSASIELLVPDFLRKDGALEVLLSESPDVLNHNIETVPGLYLKIRPGARYYASLRLLERAKELAPGVVTKSGLMLGLGETRDELMQVMDDLIAARVDLLTLGQYLQPTRRHAAVRRFVPPDEFAGLKEIALSKGFLAVASSPLTRSSYKAGELLAAARAQRAA